MSMLSMSRLLTKLNNEKAAINDRRFDFILKRLPKGAFYNYFLFLMEHQIEGARRDEE